MHEALNLSFAMYIQCFFELFENPGLHKYSAAPQQ